MAFSTLFSLLTVAVSIQSAFAAPTTNSGACSKGRTSKNKQCCIWFDVLDDLQTNLHQNTCGENAHQSLRIAFHDAIGISKSKGVSGGSGADGSIMVFPAELQLSENLSVNPIADKLRPFAAKHNVTFGDLIQFAAATGLSNCDGAPRINFFANRPIPTVQAAELSVPRGNDEATTMINRLNDGGFTTDEFVALMMSHSVAAQSAIDTNVQGAPFDSTPSKFDTQFYLETSLKGTALTGPAPTRAEDLSAITGEFRLQSDGFLARDSRTVCTWQKSIDRPRFAVSAFRDAMNKVAVNGQDTSKMVDCSDVIPVAKGFDDVPHFPPGKTVADVDAVCATKAFPRLPTDPGSPLVVAPVPHQPVLGQ